ncbi:hypothetical protein C8J57DRAFT_1232234 [Mycena rebaudengoi]|nr:hypothetical protein C8J57DRAFT_1232234 [Mycena rebaudengoi]
MANVAAYRTKEADGTILIALSVKAISVLPIIDARNDYAIYVAFSSLFVLRPLEAEELPAGMDVCTISEDITICEMVCQLADITGIKIVYRELSYEEAADRLASAGTPPFLVVDMVEAFKFSREYGHFYEEAADRLAFAGTPAFLVVAMVESFKFIYEYGYFAGKTHSSHAGLARPPHTWADFVKTTDWTKVFEK